MESAFLEFLLLPVSLTFSYPASLDQMGFSAASHSQGALCRLGLFTVFSVFVSVVQCLFTRELGFRLAKAYLERANIAVKTGDHLGRSDLQA